MGKQRMPGTTAKRKEKKLRGLNKLLLELEAENAALKSQRSPCSQACYHHQTHPCEECGARETEKLFSVFKDGMNAMIIKSDDPDVVLAASDPTSGPDSIFRNHTNHVSNAVAKSSPKQRFSLGNVFGRDTPKRPFLPIFAILTR